MAQSWHATLLWCRVTIEYQIVAVVCWNKSYGIKRQIPLCENFALFFRIRSDHNEDNSAAIVQEWLSHVKDEYSGIDFVDDPSTESESSYLLWALTSWFLWNHRKRIIILSYRVNCCRNTRSCSSVFVNRIVVGYDDNGAPFSWSEEHMKRVLELRQAALDEARRSWADFLLVGI